MSPAEVAELEREYLVHRPAVLGMLRSQFRAAVDAEEVYQEAWAELLELRKRGGPPRDVGALLFTISRRRAIDRMRSVRAARLDSVELLDSAPADGPGPDEQVQLKFDAAAARHLVQSLDPRAAAAILLRFDHGMRGPEIQRHLGVSAKRLEKIVTEAYQQIEQQLDEVGGVTTWTRRQRSLLVACELGIATSAQRRRAERLIAENAQARAMLRQMRQALRDVSVLVPQPLLLELAARPRDSSFIDRLHAASLAFRRATEDVMARTPWANATAEQAAGAGAGSLASAAAMKVALICLAVGGGAAVCVSTLPGRHHRDPEPPANAAARRTTPTPSQPVVVVKPASVKTTTSAATKPAKKPAQPKPAVSSPKARPAASPAPTGSQEFTPSTPAPSTTPAAAPLDGGGEFSP